MKWILFCLLSSILTTQVFASGTVRLVENELIGLYGWKTSESDQYVLVGDNPSGDSTATDGQGRAEIFVGLYDSDPTSGSADRTEDFIYRSSTSLAKTSLISVSATSISGFIKFQIEVDKNSAVEEFVHVGVAKAGSTSFRTIVQGSSILSQDANSNDKTTKTIKLDLNRIYAADTDGYSNFLSATDGTRRNELQLYVFLDPDESKQDEVITISDTENSGGFYIDLHFSDKRPGGEADLDPIDFGDETLVLKFEEAQVVSEMDSSLSYRVIVMRVDSAIAENQDFDAVLTGIGAPYSGFPLLKDYVDNGSVSVFDLANGQSFFFSVAYMNKFLITSPFSNGEQGQTEEQEKFLEKNACFFISAGFKEEHYVLSFYRSIRDDFLMEFGLGRAFVEFYYDNAYQHAWKIAQSPILSKTIKFLAFFGYFLIKFGLPLMLFGLIILRSLRSLRGHKEYKC